MNAGLRLTMDERSVRELVRAVRRIADRWPKNVKKSMRRFSDLRIITPAKQLAPVDTGTMRATGHSEPDRDPKKLRVEMGFGGPSADYTVDQHENETYHHEVGEVKFLQKPFERNYKELPRFISVHAPIDHKDSR